MVTSLSLYYDSLTILSIFLHLPYPWIKGWRIQKKQEQGISRVFFHRMKRMGPDLVQWAEDSNAVMRTFGSNSQPHATFPETPLPRFCIAKPNLPNPLANFSHRRHNVRKLLRW